MTGYGMLYPDYGSVVLTSNISAGICWQQDRRHW
jgi:hypothetical protein